MVALPFAPTAMAAPEFVSPSMTFAASSCVSTCPNCPQLANLHNTGNKTSDGMKCFINTYANPFIKFFAALVGVFVVISIVIGGIQYTTSADDPGKVTAAKKRIFDAVLALLAFLFLFAFLQWIVPGGVTG